MFEPWVNVASRSRSDSVESATVNNPFHYFCSAFKTFLCVFLWIKMFEHLENNHNSISSTIFAKNSLDMLPGFGCSVRRSWLRSAGWWQRANCLRENIRRLCQRLSSTCAAPRTCTDPQRWNWCLPTCCWPMPTSVSEEVLEDDNACVSFSSLVPFVPVWRDSRVHLCRQEWITCRSWRSSCHRRSGLCSRPRTVVMPSISGYTGVWVASTPSLKSWMQPCSTLEMMYEGQNIIVI